MRWRPVFAGLALALTPIAVAMFRYNNPDALLTLLLVGAVWAVWSAIETGRTNRLVLAGGLIGVAFTTKTLEAFVILPALMLAYLWCGSPRLRRRIGQLGWAALALLISSGWWVAIVELWPASSRPYLGGSTDNSELNLIFGYNGFSRILGSGGSGGSGGAGGGGGGANFGGATGLLRMFNDTVGGQISWLLPLALISLVATWWASRGRGRSSLLRAGTVLWGGVLLMFLAVFSDAKGVWHPYYTVVMAPAIAALAGAGVVSLWQLGRRSHRWVAVLPASILVTAVWAAILLQRTSGYYPWLPTTLVVLGALVATVLLLLQLDVVRNRAVMVTVACMAAVTMLAGPTAYAATTIASPSSGGLVSAGPSASGSGGFGGGFSAGGQGRSAGTSSSETALDTYLITHRNGARYLVAVTGSETAAPIILATGQAVMAMGGFTGSDPTPTLAQFEAMVRSGEVHYVLVGGSGGGGAPGGGAGGNSSTTGAIDSWAEAHGTTVPSSDVGGATGGTLYYVSSAAAGS